MSWKNTLVIFLYISVNMFNMFKVEMYNVGFHTFDLNIYLISPFVNVCRRKLTKIFFHTSNIERMWKVVNEIRMLRRILYKPLAIKCNQSLSEVNFKSISHELFNHWSIQICAQLWNMFQFMKSQQWWCIRSITSNQIMHPTYNVFYCIIGSFYIG